MSRLSDPSICPDCRAPLKDRRCTGCGLLLDGLAAATLWQRLLEADALVEQIRTGATPPPPEPAPAAPTAIPTDLPRYVPPAARPTPAKVPSSSVPAVLLGLGATCLLVAAIVFVAVAWGSLGLAAKASILLGVTALFTVAGILLTRRGLRGGAETFWLFVLTMLVIDLVSGWSADLAGLGGLSGEHLLVGVGAVLVATSVGVRLWAASTPVARLGVPIGGALIGTLLATAGAAWTMDDLAVGAACSVPVILAVAAAMVALRPAVLRGTALGTASVALISWVILAVSGLDEASNLTHHGWWHDLPGWPLLLAAGYAAAVTAVRVVPVGLRTGSAAGALVTASFFVLGPTHTDNPTALALTGIAAGLAVVAGFAPQVWRDPAAVFSLVGLILSGLVLLVRPLGVITDLRPVGDIELGLRLPPPGTDLAPWTAVAVAVAVAAGLGTLVRRISWRPRVTPTLVLSLLPSVLGLGGATALLESQPPLLSAVLAWSLVLLLALGGAVLAVSNHDPLVLFVGLVGYLIVFGLVLAVPSHLTSAGLATAITALAVAGYLRADPQVLQGAVLPLLAPVVVIGACYAGGHWAYVAGGGPNTVGLTLAVLAVALGVVAKPTSRTTEGRAAFELAALILGLVAALVPVGPTQTAAALTIVGAGVALVSLLHPDRDAFGWVAVALLTVATGYRINEDVNAPEVYVLPVAAVLLAVGVYRMRREAELSSFRALGSGLTLGLGASLVLALEDPISWRGVVVGVSGLVLLALGIAWRCAAPFIAGAVVVAALAVRHLGPVAEALPRWISLGTVGVALLLVGVTWEARRQNAEAASRYLAALR